MAGTVTRARPEGSHRLFTAPFLLSAVAAFMVAVDNLVVVTALPSIRHTFGTGIEGLQWVVSAYTLTYAVFQLSGAALGDRFGRRRVFLAGLTLFVLASAGAALAPTVWALVAARAVQGLGASMVSPLALTIVAHATPRARRAAVLGAWSGISGIGSAIGPVLGGLVVTYAPWQWIFLVNLPIAAVLLPLARLRIDESHGPRDRLDLRGVVLSSAFLLALVFALINGNDLGWAHPTVWGMLVAAAALLPVFVVSQQRAADPMLPPALLRRGAFATAVTLYLLMTFGLFGAMFLATQYFQDRLGYSPLQAGLAIAPAAALPVFIAPLTGKLSRRIGGARVLAAGLALQAAGLLALALAVTPDTAYPRMLPGLLLMGVAASLFFGQISRVILGSVAERYEGIASGAGTTFRQIGTTLGVAVLGAVFAAAGGYHSPQSFSDGFRAALLAGCGAAVLATLLALSLRRAPRMEMS